MTYKNEILEKNDFQYIGTIKPLYVNAPYHKDCLRKFFRYLNDEEFKKLDVHQYTNPKKALHIDILIVRNKTFYSIHNYCRQPKYIGSFMSNDVINECSK